MTTLLRSYVVRNPTVLTPRQIEANWLHTHPPAYQSPRYRRWLTLCAANDRDALTTELTTFLRGTDSIKQTSDLGSPWSTVIDALLSQGPTLTKQMAAALMKENATAMPKKEGECDAQLLGIRTNLADTILALAVLKRLSHPSNIDYLSILRLLTLAERTKRAGELPLSDNAIRRHLDAQVVLPRCFFRHDPCKGKMQNGPFPYLETGEAAAMGAPAPAKGCAEDGPCSCKVNDECVDQRPCCATILPYVVDLMIVRDATRCYRAGDLSFIKNILAGETLTTKHRRLERLEQVIENETDETRDTERDLQVDDKSGLQSEISDTVKNDFSFEAGLTFNGKWGSEVTGTYELTANANTSYHRSREEASKETREYSRDVIDRSVTKLQQKVRALVRTTRTLETEETNEHGFSNVGGPNVSGQYLYVDKVSRAQLFNYGRKAVLDFHLPEPAALYTKLLTNKFEGIAPVPPAQLIIKAEGITPENYAMLAEQYGVTNAPAPPPFQTTVQVTLQGHPGDGKKRSGSHVYQFSCVIPNDYAGVFMSVHSLQLNYDSGGGVSITATLGPAGNYVFHNQQNGTSAFTSPLPGIEGSNTVTVHTWDVIDFNWLLTVTCDLKAEAKAAWQHDVYTKLKEAADAEEAKYEAALEKYLGQKKEFDEHEALLKMQRNNRDPFINRETERRELKRLAISYISCQFFDGFDAMKQRVKPCGYPQMDIAQAEEQGLFVQFFEHAFDWTLMTWVFYPYFWGRKCTWPDRLREESNDLIFQSFLAAGSARVLIPIRDGFFDLVQYYLATGEIWGSNGVPPIPGDPHYVSMAQEIREQKDNFYADREGRADVTKGSNVVTINDSDWYWIYDDPNAHPPVVGGVDPLKVAADIDREIILDCIVYRIVSVELNPNVTDHSSWLITLDRPYEGDTAQKLLWSTGATYVGAPWEFVSPTTLTFLRDKSACLPCYPLKECKEAE